MKSELAFFFGRFLRDPDQVASICPSSRYLARDMFRNLNLGTDDVVLELGPGTGSFTREIERLHRQGTPVRYLGIERDEAMFRFLSRRFPDLEFAAGDIADVTDICRGRGLPPATLVLCGVPLLFMGESALTRVLADTRDCMSDRGVFRAFSYAHCYPTRRSSVLRAQVRAYFEWEFGITSVLRNLPPAVVLTGAKTG